MMEELPATIEDDWTWVEHLFVTHPGLESADGDDDHEWLQIEW